MTTEKQLESINRRLTAIEKLLQEPVLPPVTVSVERAAELLGVSARTVYDLIHSDGFPCVPIGKRRVVSVERLKEWVDERSGAVGA